MPRGRGAAILAVLKEKKHKLQDVGSQLTVSINEQCPRPKVS